MGKKKIDYRIKVAAQAFYLEEQSIPDQDHYVFAYTVLIQNQGNIAAIGSLPMPTARWRKCAATGWSVSSLS